MELGGWSDTASFNEKELKLLKCWEQKPLQQHHDMGWPCCLSEGTHYFNNCSLGKTSGFGLFRNNNKEKEKSWAVLSSVPPPLLTLCSLGLMTHFSSIQNQIATKQTMA